MKKIKKIFFICCFFMLPSCSVLNPPTPEPTLAVVNQNPQAKLIVEGKLVPEKDIKIVSMVSGKIEEIFVSENQIINQDEIVIQIEGMEKLNAQIQSAKLELLKAKKDLEKLNRTAELEFNNAQLNLSQAELDLIKAKEAYSPFDSSNYQEKIDNAKIDVNDAEVDLEKAQDNFEPYKDLDQDNLLRKQFEKIVEEKQDILDELTRDRDNLIQSREFALATLNLSETAVDEARYQFELKQDGPDKDLLELVNAKVEAAQSNLDASEYLLRTIQIQSPISGKVVQKLVDVGDQVVMGQPLLVIIDDTNWFVETVDFTELDLTHIEEGDRVLLKADAYPDLSIDGEVESISQWFYEKSGDIHYQVRIKVLDIVPEFRWGLTFEVTVP
ncbi:MAG: HlyD family secretion protein [Anaerolineaceae bacterium]